MDRGFRPGARLWETGLGLAVGGVFLPVGGTGWAVKQKGSPGGKSPIFHGGIPLDRGASARSCQGFLVGYVSLLLADLDDSGKLPQTDGEHEKGRIRASDGRGLLPAVPPGDKAPVRTGCLQTRFADQAEKADRWREESGRRSGIGSGNDKVPCRTLSGHRGGCLPERREME